jgi:phosphoenolpyruvate carboxykinase (GTP)
MKEALSLMSNIRTENKTLKDWVEKVAHQTRPDRVHWCDGSEEENRELLNGMLADGTMIELNQEKWPGCYLHRSDPNDVARVENLTFICTPKREDAGPNNNWMSPAETHEKVGKLFDGCMAGRTMYVIPYLMGPLGSPLSKFGVEVTDSPYVVANMRTMTRIGQPALDHLADSDEIVFGLHSIGDLNPDRRYICHLPDERLIMSFGSGYGGNALLGKKCFALRLASAMAREQGWMAEHMLILGVESPEGELTYIAAAFPSACGKTNLAMLVPPHSMPGWKVWTVGDDIAWLRPDENGQLWAINPESGFFGVLPGTNHKTNPNAMASLSRNTIFTNAAMDENGEPWWEGKDGNPPSRATDWRGRAWTPASKEKAAHPNSRFTSPASQCPSISPFWEDPKGVPISAFVFGGRRSKLFPLIHEAFNWEHGVYIGASMSSETTAAATGAVGVVRRDPMAMLPFCGYNMADYWGHWITMGRRHKRLPKIFQVNWFRKNDGGAFLWPGYGENLRALRWIVDSVRGRAKKVESPIGYLPAEGAIDLSELNISKSTIDELMRIDPEAWREDMAGRKEFFDKFGSRLPPEITREHKAQLARLAAE